MSDVFISYAREDSARAEQIARALSAMGLQVFWDSEIPPGKTWADYIEEKLSVAKAMIVLWSAHSTTSQWVREEARMGRDSGKLIPAMLDRTPAPFGFGEVQAANLSNWRGETNSADWVRFANAVDAAVRGPGAAPRPIPQTISRGASAYVAPPAFEVEQLTPPQYVMKCLRMYFNGNGRARRLEYWIFVLFETLVLVAAVAVDLAVFGLNSYTGAANAYWFTLLGMLGLAAPGVAVLIRRFHDVGLSGWLAVVSSALTFVFGIGSIIIFVVALIPGKPVENKYGPPPKAA